MAKVSIVKDDISKSHDQTRIMEILHETKKLAQEYRKLTGKPLGITGEVAEYEAARILGVELTPARQAGYDAVEHQDGKTRYLQIKGRCMLPGCKPGQRLGSIDIKKDWDAILMVLLDENFEGKGDLRSRATSRPQGPVRSRLQSPQ
jgi:hypothetical protein